jgi:hypothetical protein
MIDTDIPSLIARLEKHKPSLHHGGCADCYASAMDDAARKRGRLHSGTVTDMKSESALSYLVNQIWP